MNNDIKVSILVPFYKVENYVGKCVESLFRQTYKNIEYVFVNDCTPDKSMQVINENIDKYGVRDKCKIIEHKTNKGISTSRNDCLDNATGDYILFIDSDDYIDLDMVESLVNAAKENDADISGCGYTEEFGDRSVDMPQVYTNDHNEMLKAITVLKIKGVMWKLLIRRSIVEDNNVRFIPDNTMVDDYLFCCQVFFYAKRFASVDRCMYHYIQFNPNNYSKTTVFNVTSQAKAIIKTEEFYKENGVYDIVKEELQQRKFLSKLPLLLNKNCYDVKTWRQLFPDSNFAWNNINLGMKNKLIVLLAQTPLYRLIPFIR